MLEIVYSPQWFYGIDIIFEFINVIAAILIAFFSYKVYKFTREKRCLFFGLSFIAISLSFISKILTNFQFYYNFFRKSSIINSALITVTTHKSLNFFVSAYFFHRFFMLLALTGLFFIVGKYHKRLIPLFIFFIAVITAFSTYEYFIYHVTTSLLLGYIFYHYYANYSYCKTKNTFLVAFSFFLILISQIVFINIITGIENYVLAQVIQVLGYIILLIAYIRISKNDKKNKARHN